MKGGSRKRYGTSGEKALTEPEVARLLEAVRVLDDEALLRLAISTGIRREDIVAIPLSGLDLEHGWVTYYEEKKDRTWKVPVGGATLTCLAKYVRVLPKGSRWLFPRRGHPAHHVSGRTAYNILDRWCRAVGISTPRPFHALRATCVKLCQRRGWSVEQVMALTGDTWRTVTEHYSTPTGEEMALVAKERPVL